MNHPLDGNMIAADAHYEAQRQPEEGDRCGIDGCDGTLEWKEPEDCSCHISAPCHSHVDAPLWCPTCYEEIEN